MIRHFPFITSRAYTCFCLILNIWHGSFTVNKQWRLDENKKMHSKPASFDCPSVNIPILKFQGWPCEDDLAYSINLSVHLRCKTHFFYLRTSFCCWLHAQGRYGAFHCRLLRQPQIQNSHPSQKLGQDRCRPSSPTYDNISFLFLPPHHFLHIALVCETCTKYKL